MSDHESMKKPGQGDATGVVKSAVKTLVLAAILFVAFLALFSRMGVGDAPTSGPCDHLYENGSSHAVIDACIHEHGLEGPCHDIWHVQDWDDYDACLEAEFG